MRTREYNFDQFPFASPTAFPLATSHLRTLSTIRISGISPRSLDASNADIISPLSKQWRLEWLNASFYSPVHANYMEVSARHQSTCLNYTLLLQPNTETKQSNSIHSYRASLANETTRSQNLSIMQLGCANATGGSTPNLGNCFRSLVFSFDQCDALNNNTWKKRITATISSTKIPTFCELYIPWRPLC